ncbi:MAG: peptide-methionine (S)-S-oxide reductase MsrA [Culicoidibacterales bacterium]
MKKIVVAGGCFWGVEAYFQQVHGITSTQVGYSQGLFPFPTYEQVCSGTTGHAEVCELTYNSDELSLLQLLEHLFNIIDPTSINRQGNDKGNQYRTGIYYIDQNDVNTIKAFILSKQANYTKPIVVEVESAKPFYRAEDYHQHYLQKNPNGYCHINLDSITKLQP